MGGDAPDPKVYIECFLFSFFFFLCFFLFFLYELLTLRLIRKLQCNGQIIVNMIITECSTLPALCHQKLNWVNDCLVYKNSYAFPTDVRDLCLSKSQNLKYWFFLSWQNTNAIQSSLTRLLLFTNPSARAEYDTRSIFKRSLTGLNSEFSFS